MKAPRILFILASVALLVAIYIDLQDDNPLKLAGSICLFLGFALQAMFYPVQKGWAMYATVASFAAAIIILVYRTFVVGL